MERSEKRGKKDSWKLGEEGRKTKRRISDTDYLHAVSEVHV